MNFRSSKILESTINDWLGNRKADENSGCFLKKIFRETGKIMKIIKNLELKIFCKLYQKIPMEDA